MSRSPLRALVLAAALPLASESLAEGPFRENQFGLLYAKGPWLLSRLHDEIGDEKFLSFLKSYQKTLRGKCGSTKLAEELLHVMTGKDFTPFFDANFWGTAMPN